MQTRKDALDKIARLDARLNKLIAQTNQLLTQRNALSSRKKKLQAKLTAPDREDRSLRQDVQGTVGEINKKRLIVEVVDGPHGPKIAYRFPSTKDRLAKFAPGDPITLRFRCLKPVLGESKGQVAMSDHPLV
jgi:seryl-tRNA synthetase